MSKAAILFILLEMFVKFVTDVMGAFGAVWGTLSSVDVTRREVILDHVAIGR